MRCPQQLYSCGILLARHRSAIFRGWRRYVAAAGIWWCCFIASACTQHPDVCMTTLLCITVYWMGRLLWEHWNVNYSWDEFVSNNNSKNLTELFPLRTAEDNKCSEAANGVAVPCASLVIAARLTSWRLGGVTSYQQSNGMLLWLSCLHGLPNDWRFDCSNLGCFVLLLLLFWAKWWRQQDQHKNTIKPCWYVLLGVFLSRTLKRLGSVMTTQRGQCCLSAGCLLVAQ